MLRRQPGKMVHSRWLATANRILRLYVSTAEPDESLVILVHFIIKVYALTWFDIKTESSCIDGLRHLFNIIKRSRYLPLDLKKIVDKVLQRNWSSRKRSFNHDI